MPLATQAQMVRAVYMYLCGCVCIAVANESVRCAARTWWSFARREKPSATVDAMHRISLPAKITEHVTCACVLPRGLSSGWKLTCPEACTSLTENLASSKDSGSIRRTCHSP